jgi:predicted acyltransferase
VELTPPPTRIAPHHVLSVDVLRGLTMAAMILVNNPGDWSAVYPPLLHAYWTGFTFADLVFPAFVFIMGVSMSFSLARRLSSGASTRELYGRIARRAGVLIALGLALNALAAIQDGTPLRFPGVLQRLALAYVLASVVVIHVVSRRWFAVVAAMLLGHWALLMLVPFGGHPAGTLTPEHNLARLIDVSVFGRHGLTIPNDPEGILGTLPAAATALLGAAAGETIRRAAGYASVVRALAAFGAILFGLGYVWSWALPLSKPLWTGSFTLTAAGLTAIALSATHLGLTTARRWWRPFLWLGVNPIVIYVSSEIIGRLVDRVWIDRADGVTIKAWVYWRVIEPAVEPWSDASASLIFGIGYVALWIVAAGALYRFRIRIHV